MKFPFFNKMNLIRVPLRLGFDVFENKLISPQKTDMLIQTLKAFRHLINAYHVDAIKACATSAMRDAQNAADILAIVKKETGWTLK
jgi:exopolyphosphatase/guanosine-5'-triphosphate,3'-diphosphate pyrophosphatase